MSFKTLLSCVLCRHHEVIDPPKMHPQCPKCGGPVRLVTAAEGSAELSPPETGATPTAPSAGPFTVASDVKLTGEQAWNEMRDFVVKLSERVDDDAKAYFEAIGREVVHVPAQLRALIERAAPSNVREAIASLEKAPEPPTIQPDTTSELPPGSA